MYYYVAKTKALISFAVTGKLICVFVFTYAKSRFSHNEAQLFVLNKLMEMRFSGDMSNITALYASESEQIKATLSRGLHGNPNDVFGSDFGKYVHVSYLSHVARNPMFSVSDQVKHKQGCTATEDG